MQTASKKREGPPLSRSSCVMDAAAANFQSAPDREIYVLFSVLFSAGTIGDI